MTQQPLSPPATESGGAEPYLHGGNLIAKLRKRAAFYRGSGLSAEHTAALLEDAADLLSSEHALRVKAEERTETLIEYCKAAAADYDAIRKVFEGLHGSFPLTVADLCESATFLRDAVVGDEDFIKHASAFALAHSRAEAAEARANALQGELEKAAPCRVLVGDMLGTVIYAGPGPDGLFSINVHFDENPYPESWTKVRGNSLNTVRPAPYAALLPQQKASDHE